MKSSPKKTLSGIPSFDSIDGLVLSSLLSFFFSAYRRITRLLQAARAFNVPSCCSFKPFFLIRQNTFRNSLPREVCFAESRTASAYDFCSLHFSGCRQQKVVQRRHPFGYALPGIVAGAAGKLR